MVSFNVFGKISMKCLTFSLASSEFFKKYASIAKIKALGLLISSKLMKINRGFCKTNYLAIFQDSSASSCLRIYSSNSKLCCAEEAAFPTPYFPATIRCR